MSKVNEIIIDKIEDDNLPEFHPNQFGNDIVLEHDPTDDPIVQHVPKIDKKKKLKKDEFYVEKIINHKGRSDKKSTMKFFVKWLGYDDTHNSWIPWEEAKYLAALDTYLMNNVDILVPIDNCFVSSRSFNAFNKRNKIRNKKRNTTHEDDFQYENLPYIINYLAPKSIPGVVKEDAWREFMNLPPYRAYASRSASPSDKTVPRSASQIPYTTDPPAWKEATKSELDSMYTNRSWHSISPDIDITKIPKKLILPSMLIYEKQYNPDKTFKKYKARLVIRGDKWHDIYDMNTYASTMKSESVRIM